MSVEKATKYPVKSSRLQIRVTGAFRLALEEVAGEYGVPLGAMLLIAAFKGEPRLSKLRDKYVLGRAKTVGAKK